MKLSSIITRKSELLSQIDPQRIYVENIRSLFNLPYGVAKFFCEMAVKQGYFVKKKALLCPNEECGRIVKVIDFKDFLPENLSCHTCLMLDRDNHEFTPTDRDTLEFYQLTDKK